MSKNKRFWQKDEKGKTTIIQSKLNQFIEDSGFSKVKKEDGSIMYVKELGNVVYEVYDTDIIDFVKNYLKKIDDEDVFEAFSKGITGYLSPSKLKLLKTTELLNDRDTKDSSYFHFSNISCQVGAGYVKSTIIEDLPLKIWNKRLIDRPFYSLSPYKKSQFETFCFNLCGQDLERFLVLRTIIGYLLHRYQDPKNARAVILVDEKISFNGEANGGTGKTLLIKGIEHCRELVVMDGKNMKTKSWFKNQRIDFTTDVVFYDDVTADFNLEQLYSMITTGIPVEKKYKGEIFIKPEDAPKIVISSNYVVSGTGGNTDTRRRCDFEVSDHYGPDNTPFDEFGNRFFEDWEHDEWNAFYSFMMGCVSTYLKNGLLIAEPINLKKNTLINSTSIEFYTFLKTNPIKHDKWLLKSEIKETFVKEFPNQKNVSPHQFTKWMKLYAKDAQLIYKDRKAGEKYQFMLQSKDSGKEVKDGK